MSDKFAVVCWLWNDPKYRWNPFFRYGIRHVNHLYRGVKRFLSMPHEFVCITDVPKEIADSPRGFDPGIRRIPLWNDNRKMGGCYVRLRAFAEDMAQIIAPRFVWIDVDSVVVGPLDPLFDRPEEFVAWKDINPPTPYCGSMIMQTAGSRSQVWTKFDPMTSPKAAKRYIGTDQAHIGNILGPNEATWDQSDGVWSFRRMVKQHRGQLAPGARIVFFHGRNDPSTAADQKAAPWIRQFWK